MSTDLIPNGNICLTFGEGTSKALIKFAHKYFADMADGYLLGPHSIPHITLSHIHHNKPQPRALRRDLGNIAITHDTLHPNKLTQRAGTNAHDGYIWMEFGITPIAPWLIDLKDKVDAVLRNYDITILTPPAPDWQPHITVCRIKKDSKPLATDALKYKADIDTANIHLSLGVSDDYGQFQKIFWKRPLA